MNTRVFICFLFAILCLLGPALGKSVLWEVRGNGQLAYVLGSVHMAKADLYPLAPAIDKAFHSAEELVLEADLGAMFDAENQSRLLAYGLLPDAKSLKSLVSEKTYAYLAAESKKLGLNIDLFNRFKPWFFGFTIYGLKLVKMGYKVELGVDYHFWGKAREKSMPVKELEGFMNQMKLLDSFSFAEQEQFLLYLLKDMEVLDAAIDLLFSAWKQGDIKRLEELFMQVIRENPALKPLYAKLLYGRNRKMADKITELMQQKKVLFIIVGAAHLVGKDSVIQELQTRGYAVKQL